jgi:hypothetical protein
VLFICKFFAANTFRHYDRVVTDEQMDFLKQTVRGHCNEMLRMDGYMTNADKEVVRCNMPLGIVEKFIEKRNLQHLVPQSIVNIACNPVARMSMTRVNSNAVRSFLHIERDLYNSAEFFNVAVPYYNQHFLDNLYMQGVESIFTAKDGGFNLRAECHVPETYFFALHQTLFCDRPLILTMFNRHYVTFGKIVYYTRSIFDAVVVWCHLLKTPCYAKVDGHSLDASCKFILCGSRAVNNADMSVGNSTCIPRDDADVAVRKTKQDTILKRAAVWGKTYDRISKLERMLLP